MLFLYDAIFILCIGWWTQEINGRKQGVQPKNDELICWTWPTFVESPSFQPIPERSNHILIWSHVPSPRSCVHIVVQNIVVRFYRQHVHSSKTKGNGLGCSFSYSQSRWRKRFPISLPRSCRKKNNRYVSTPLTACRCVVMSSAW